MKMHFSPSAAALSAITQTDSASLCQEGRLVSAATRSYDCTSMTSPHRCFVCGDTLEEGMLSHSGPCSVSQPISSIPQHHPWVSHQVLPSASWPIHSGPLRCTERDKVPPLSEEHMIWFRGACPVLQSHKPDTIKIRFPNVISAL
jgi:hypothetical protein